MLKTSSVEFSNVHAIYNSKPFDGYLAFLPESVSNSATIVHHTTTLNTLLETNVSYRHFNGRDFCWFEFKDTKLSTDLSIQITTPGNYLWLLINMRTGILLTLDSRHLVPTDMLLCYQTLADDHLISLGNNSSWFLLLGIDGRMLQELTAEYAQLKPLFAAAAEKNISHRIIGTMRLHAKLKRILDGLQQMEFRPFSTYYQLANWNIRFFRHVFQEMEPPSVDKKDHEIELYYKAMAYIRDNFYDDQTNIETIASALHVSESTLKRAFQDKPFKVTEQIIEYRLQEARACIRNSDTPITTIAASLNFACPKNFKRLFTKRFMISPLQYRQSTRLKRLF
ncbi:helix-turn-helix transcriptional regulator [Sphingobacterium sp. SGR-19]|uniref:helix-turn-helix transcriptional regulator n=1 Tax=Sphingobacterium sp. SGR-19 TaxID=2710886 RepID=UPI0013EC8FD8|nr:AraC family transcriptional regulator [Sphingobacterium sp. SGR-19]NGM63790.1 helix-turn-helix transcriptional regulator [Sphingobacterium sp. SGR-19]